MPTLLLTGASGFLGRHVAREAARAWQVIAVGRNAPVGVHHVMVDLSEPGFAAKLPQCDALVHLAAEARMDMCEREPERARAVNVEATRVLAEMAARLRIPCVFTSTDLVFGGTKAPYHEEAKPDPMSEYGRQKAEAEAVVMRANPEARIVRLSLLYDLCVGASLVGARIGGRPQGPPLQQDFLSKALTEIAAGRHVTCYSDEWRTPLWVEDAALAVMRVLVAPPGVYHAGGPERMSRLGMVERAVEMDSRFRSHDVLRLVRGVSRLSHPLGKYRPEDVSLTGEKLRGLGWRATPFEEVTITTP